MKIPIIFIALVIIFNNGHHVSAKCEGSRVDTPWSGCLPSTESEDEICPQDLLKLSSNEHGCGSKRVNVGVESRPLVCCLLAPLVNLKVKDAPCLSGSESSSAPEGDKAAHKKKKSKSH